MVAIMGAHLRMAANHDVALADPEKPLEHFKRCLELVADLADGRRGEPAEQVRAAELQVVLAEWLFVYPCKRIHAIFAGQEAADGC